MDRTGQIVGRIPETDETVSSIFNVQNQILIHDNAMNEKDISV